MLGLLNAGLQDSRHRGLYEASLVASIKTENFGLAGKLADLVKHSADVEDDDGSISSQVRAGT